MHSVAGSGSAWVLTIKSGMAFAGRRTMRSKPQTGARSQGTSWMGGRSAGVGMEGECMVFPIAGDGTAAFGGVSLGPDTDTYQLLLFFTEISRHYLRRFRNAACAMQKPTRNVGISASFSIRPQSIYK